MSNYVKKYNVGNIMMDLPYNSFIHELPLLSFSDNRNSVNLSLVYNHRLNSNDTANMFNIKNGYKLNLQKKLIVNNGLAISYVDEYGKIINLLPQNNSDVNCAFNDDSKRILRTIEDGFEVEYSDFSKEVFDNNGNLIEVIDKYGCTYLQYEYQNGLLKNINYNNKKLEFEYGSGLLYSIIYKVSASEVVTIAIGYITNGVSVHHYSGVTFYNKFSNNTYETKGQGSEGSSTIMFKKTCEYSGYTMELTSYEGANELDKTIYTFPDYVIEGIIRFNQVEVETKKGFKQRIEFKNENPLYSYEIQSDATFISDGKYYGTVNILKTLDDSVNFELKSGLRNQDNESLTLYDTTNKIWRAQTSSSSNVFGYYLITGWAKFSGTYIDEYDDKIYVSNISSEFGVEIGANLKPYNQWHFFAYKLGISATNIYVRPSCPSKVELKDVRIAYYITDIFDSNWNRRNLLNEGGLIDDNNNFIPLKDVNFYSSQTDETPLNLSIDDISRFLRRKVLKNKTDEIYYNNGKNFKYGVSDLIVKIGNNERKSISEYSLGTRYFKNNQCLLTKIALYSDYENSSTKFYITNYIDNNWYSHEYLDENYEVKQEERDGIVTLYTRDNGLLINKTVSGLSDIQITYTDTIITVKDLKAIGHRKTGIEYHRDPVWGTIYKVKYADGTKITDTYDDDSSTLLQKKFDKQTLGLIHNYGYSKGLVSSLSCDTLNYNFEYSKYALTKVQKFGQTIEEHTHTDSTQNSYYPNQSNYVYSLIYNFDKYNRLSSIDNVLENTYNTKSEFYSDGEPDIYSTNNSSKLVMSEDKLLNKKTRYHYNTDDMISKIEVSPSSNYSIKEVEENFDYDSLNRLSNLQIKIGNDEVNEEFMYVNDIMNDGRIEENKYILGNKNQTNEGVLVTNGYDDYNRIDNKTYKITDSNNVSKVFKQDYNIQYNTVAREECIYKGTGNSIITKGEFVYSYDNFDRIIKITKDSKEITYEYDIYGRLIRENNEFLDKTIVYSYNDIGNIISKKEYSYTTIENITITPSKTINYTYDTAQKDRLITFDTTTIPYNTLGCPTKYKGYDLTWNKGKLTGLSKGTIDTELESISYTYNAYGQRVSKSQYKTKGFNAPTQFPIGELTNYNKEYKYDNSGRLIKEVGTKVLYQGGTHSETIDYLYDRNTIIGMKYTYDTSVNTYYFRRNILGDVIEIYDINGNLKVKYNYDAYGNCTIASETTDTNLAIVNPIRYRGYYYDVETNLFLVSSRYYSPELCRWISPDDIEYLDPESVNGLNLYCYCFNNPIMYVDPDGHMPKWLENTLKIGGAVLLTAALVAGSIFIAGPASIILAGAALGAAGGLIGGGISSGISSVMSGGSFIDGFADGALSGSITGAISGAVAASPLRVWGQVGVNALISGGSYIINNYNNFNIGDFLFNSALGGLAGLVGGDGWTKAGKTLAYDLAFNGIKGSFMMLGRGALNEFSKPIIKSSIVGSAGFINNIFKKLR